MGRQILHFIDQHFRVSEVEGQVYDLNHLLNVMMTNINLYKAINVWNILFTGIPRRTEEDVLEHMLMNRFRSCGHVKDDICDYERLPKEQRIYSTLMSRAWAVLE